MQAIPDIITIIGSSFFQPIGDLVARMVEKDAPEPAAMGTTDRENGYAAAIVILLVACLESYVARIRFTRRDEIAALKGGLSVPDLLLQLFPELPGHGDLIEVFLLRNLVLHNHLYHIDVATGAVHEAATLAGPKDFGYQVNQHFAQSVDLSTRKTKRLSLNASPTAVDRSDVRQVFNVVWRTLQFMHNTNFSDTPIGVVRSISFRGKRIQFEQLIRYL